MALTGRSRVRVVDVVHALLEDETRRNMRVVVLAPDQATLVAPSGKLLRVLEVPDEGQALEVALEQCQRNNEKPGTDVIFVGGSSLHRSRIEAHFPKMPMVPFRVAHLASNGAVSSWPAGRSGDLEKSLEHVSRISVEEEDRLAHLALSEDQARRLDSQQRAEFFAMMRSRKAPLTRLLLIVIAVIFVAQVVGFSDSAAALGIGSGDGGQEWLVYVLKMGALYSPLVQQDGQWWRMLTAGFLHHGLMHVAVNSFALFILGSQLEKVLGGARYLVVYAAALVGGSIGSYYLTDGISVGASGAIWGLLGAQLALAYGRPPVLPSSIAESIRPLARQNLVLNVLISLVPGIDWAAHFGGGLAGGLVLASGVLYVRGDPQTPPPQLPLMALFSALLLAAGAGLCLLLWSGVVQSPIDAVFR